MSKDDKIKQAAEKRHEMLKDADQRAEGGLTEEAIEGLRNRAETAAEVKVQPRVGTLTGDVDVDAMGDVKGDGGDAKYYDDGDPAKALGVPVWQHGLASTKEGVDEVAQADRTLNGVEPSEATKEEIEAGKQATTTRTTDTTTKNYKKK
jgi:hypothetical protein